MLSSSDFHEFWVDNEGKRNMRGPTNEPEEWQKLQRQSLREYLKTLKPMKYDGFYFVLNPKHCHWIFLVVDLKKHSVHIMISQNPIFCFNIYMMQINLI